MNAKTLSVLVVMLVLCSGIGVTAGENNSYFLAPETFDVVHTVPLTPPQAALIRIVENHPSVELRGWFKRGLRERRFAVTWMDKLPGSPTDDQHQCMQVMNMYNASAIYKSKTPVLVARIDFLTDPAIPDTERYLALFHEWVHLQDALADPRFPIFEPKGTESAARNLYRVELKAHYKAALFAKKYGFESKLFAFPIDTYRLGGVGAIRAVLAMNLLSSKAGYDTFREAILEETMKPFDGIPLK